jgi:hypothetical protein
LALLPGEARGVAGGGIEEGGAGVFSNGRFGGEVGEQLERLSVRDGMEDGDGQAFLLGPFDEREQFFEPGGFLRVRELLVALEELQATAQGQHLVRGFLPERASASNGSATRSSSGQVFGQLDKVRAASSWTDSSWSSRAARTAARAFGPPAAARACREMTRRAGSPF